MLKYKQIFSFRTVNYKVYFFDSFIDDVNITTSKDYTEHIDQTNIVKIRSGVYCVKERLRGKTFLYYFYSYYYYNIHLLYNSVDNILKSIFIRRSILKKIKIKI